MTRNRWFALAYIGALALTIIVGYILSVIYS